VAGGIRIHKHIEAISVLLLCPTIAEAAKQLGIGDRTLRRWMRTEPFRSNYLEARQQVMTEAIASLQKAAAKAVESLVDKLNDPDESSGIQVAAARAILEYSFRGADREGLLYRQGAYEARGAHEWATDEDVEALLDENAS
jgi:transposase-like protein